GISMPASVQAWIKVIPAGTSCSLPSMMSLGTCAGLLLRCVDPGEIWRGRRVVTRIVQRGLHERPKPRPVLLKVARVLKVGRQQIVAMRFELDADCDVPFLGRRHLQDLLAGIEDG